MRIDIATLFPEMCEAVLGESIVGRARANGLIKVRCLNIRDYTLDKFGRVDDTPYGGGRGMVMQPEPIYRLFEAVCAHHGVRPRVVYMSPKGTVLTQQKALDFTAVDPLLILCGHYEGVDQRILDEIVDEEISVGDYVLTGGELPALVLADSVARLIPGVLPEEVCFTEESHFNGLLEYPHYTRPYEWRGRTVPDVLISGHHANIEKWRHAQAVELTARNRPDMLSKYIKDKEF